MEVVQEAVVRFRNIRRAKRGDEGVTNAQIGHWLFDLRVRLPDQCHPNTGRIRFFRFYLAHVALNL